MELINGQLNYPPIGGMYLKKKAAGISLGGGQKLAGSVKLAGRYNKILPGAVRKVMPGQSLGGAVQKKKSGEISVRQISNWAKDLIDVTYDHIHSLFNEFAFQGIKNQNQVNGLLDLFHEILYKPSVYKHIKAIMNSSYIPYAQRKRAAPKRKVKTQEMVQVPEKFTYVTPEGVTKTAIQNMGYIVPEEVSGHNNEDLIDYYEEDVPLTEMSGPEEGQISASGYQRKKPSGKSIKRPSRSKIVSLSSHPKRKNIKVVV